MGTATGPAQSGAAYALSLARSAGINLVNYDRKMLQARSLIFPSVVARECSLVLAESNKQKVL